MYRRDYILRIIEQIAQFISKLLKLQQEDKAEQAYDFLINQSARVTGLSYDEFLQMSIDDFKQKLDESEISDTYLDTLGRYFMTSADVCLCMEKDEEAIHHIELAKFCFSEAEQRFQSFSFSRQLDLEKLNQLRIRVGLF
nr:hypothetical protein [uncultured Carboxylicivirga sp.]